MKNNNKKNRSVARARKAGNAWALSALLPNALMLEQEADPCVYALHIEEAYVCAVYENSSKPQCSLYLVEEGTIFSNDESGDHGEFWERRTPLKSPYFRDIKNGNKKRALRKKGYTHKDIARGFGPVCMRIQDGEIVFR